MVCPLGGWGVLLANTTVVGVRFLANTTVAFERALQCR